MEHEQVSLSTLLIFHWQVTSTNSAPHMRLVHMIRMSNEAADPVLQRSLEIRKSVESAVLDLEQEVIRCFNPSVHFSLLILT